ncbi:MAG: DUF4231 domain-containing protein [bacterium]|nr:DUF4231 domain-containing protein [bacterium]
MSEEARFERTTLENALRRYATFDDAANAVQRKFFGAKIWILTVGVAATTLAIVYSTLWLEDARPPLTDGHFYLWLAVVAMPIIGSVLAAGAAKLIRGLDWVSLRGAAESIKREVYRYRCQVGVYSPGSQVPGTRDEKLASMVEQITGRLLDTDVLATGLPPYSGDEVPGYGSRTDDGLSDLTPAQYLDWRLADQRDWFKGKSVTLESRNSLYQWAIAILGGVGTLLAAVGQEIWVPVSVALATALTSYLTQRNVEATLAGYTRAGLELDNVVTWWSGLSAEAKGTRASFAALVNRTETILGSENATWVQSMQETLAQLPDGACAACGQMSADDAPEDDVPVDETEAAEEDPTGDPMAEEDDEAVG